MTTLPRAKHALSAAEIEALHGDVIREGLLAFRNDPDYLVEMAQAATRLRKRAERRAREAQAEEARTGRLADRIALTYPTSSRRVLLRDARVYRARQQGLSKQDILASLGITLSDYKTATRRLAAAGLPVPDQRVGAVVKDRARDLRDQGLTLRQIGERMGLSEATVRYHLKG